MGLKLRIKNTLTGRLMKVVDKIENLSTQKYFQFQIDKDKVSLFLHKTNKTTVFRMGTKTKILNIYKIVVQSSSNSTTNKTRTMTEEGRKKNKCSISSTQEITLLRDFNLSRYFKLRNL
jgi:ribosomal protein S14